MAAKRDKLMTASDLASLCEVDLKTIHNWVDRGRIPHFRTPGRHLRFRAQDVAEFLRTWGYDVPRELAHAGVRTALVIGGGAARDAVAHAIGQPEATVRHVEHPYDALVVAGIDRPDVIVVDADAAAASVDLRPLFEALRRAMPEASLVAIVDALRDDVPPFVPQVVVRDQRALEGALGGSRPANDEGTRAASGDR